MRSETYTIQGIKVTLIAPEHGIVRYLQMASTGKTYFYNLVNSIADESDSVWTCITYNELIPEEAYVKAIAESKSKYIVVDRYDRFKSKRIGEAICKAAEKSVVLIDLKNSADAGIYIPMSCASIKFSADEVLVRVDEDFI